MKLFKKKNKELTEDEIIEKELEEEFKDPNPFDFKSLINLLKSKSEDDIEYESLLTEEEKQELLKEKQDDKNFMIKCFAVLASIFIIILGVGVFFVNENKSDLYKITEPLLKDYYKTKYNGNGFKSIEKLVIDDKETDIVLATTKDDKHIMAINNELIGDDINNRLNKELIKELDGKLADFGILTSEVNLSYKDYYHTYNKRIPYINVVPDQKLDDLKASKKLTVEYVAFYDGGIDNNTVANILNDYSDDSKFYFIKLDNGLPTELDVISKESQFNIIITGDKEVDKGVYTYNLDRTNNAINTVKFTRLANSSTPDYPKHKLTNIFKIELESDHSYSKDKIIGNYFLIKMNTISKNNLIQVYYSDNEHAYFEEEIRSYNNFVIINFGGSSYLIGDNEVTFGSLVENKSFLCNLGLC